MACSAIAPNQSKTEIFVRFEDGDYKLFQSADWAMANITLQDEPIWPGFKNEVNGYLYWSLPLKSSREDPNQILDRYLLPRPGQYKLQARLRSLDGKDQILSNVLEIHVQEPTDTDALAYDTLIQLKYPFFLMSINGTGEKPSERVLLTCQEKFLADHPQSQYAQYLEYTLGRTYMLKALFPETVRKDELKEKGIALMEKAASHKVFVAHNALKQLFDLALEGDQIEKAQNYMKDMKSRFPDSRVTIDSEQKLDRKIKQKK
jgi:hypothetical protein